MTVWVLVAVWLVPMGKDTLHLENLQGVYASAAACEAQRGKLTGLNHLPETIGKLTFDSYVCRAETPR
jgi:hypothetical protein